MMMAEVIMVAPVMVMMSVMVAKVMMTMVVPMMVMAAAKMTSMAVAVPVTMSSVMVMLRSRPNCWNERHRSNQREETQKPDHGNSSTCRIRDPSHRPPFTISWMDLPIIRVSPHCGWPPGNGGVWLVRGRSPSCCTQALISRWTKTHCVCWWSAAAPCQAAALNSIHACDCDRLFAKVSLYVAVANDTDNGKYRKPQH
jgi:hypothetical protein